MSRLAGQTWNLLREVKILKKENDYLQKENEMLWCKLEQIEEEYSEWTNILSSGRT